MTDKIDSSSSCPISLSSQLPSSADAEFKQVKRKIQTMLLLRFNTLGCLVNSLELEYFTYFGEELNCKKLGFSSLLEMLERMTMEVSLSEISGRNSKIVHAQPLDHQTTLKSLRQLFTRDQNQNQNQNSNGKQISTNDQPLRKRPRNQSNEQNINTFKNPAPVNNQNPNPTKGNPNSEWDKTKMYKEKDGTCDISFSPSPSHCSTPQVNSNFISNSKTKPKLAQEILVKIEHISPSCTSAHHDLSSSKSDESPNQNKLEETRKSKRERQAVSTFDSHSNSKSTPKATPTKTAKKGDQKKPTAAPSSELKTLSDILQSIERDLEAKKSGPTLEQAWLSIFDMTIEEPDLDVLLKVTELFIHCLDTFPNKHKLLEFMLGAVGNIIMDDELRRTLMLSTEIPRVLFELLASPKWTRINFKIEFSVVELLIAFLSDGSENWKFENFSRNYVCSKIQSTILNKWDVKTDQIVKDFHYNSLESNVSLLAADHTPVCQLWSTWTLANFTEKRPELYVKKLKKENGVEALEFLISKSHGKEIKKYAQMALENISSFDS